MESTDIVKYMNNYLLTVFTNIKKIKISNKLGSNVPNTLLIHHWKAICLYRAIINSTIFASFPNMRPCRRTLLHGTRLFFLGTACSFRFSLKKTLKRHIYCFSISQEGWVYLLINYKDVGGSFYDRCLYKRRVWFTVLYSKRR